MPSFTTIGLVSWVSAFCLVVYQGIKSLMDPVKTVWVDVTLKQIIPPEQQHHLTDISWAFAQSTVNYLVTMPLYILLIAIGIIAFALHAVFGD